MSMMLNADAAIDAADAHVWSWSTLKAERLTWRERPCLDDYAKV